MAPPIVTWHRIIQSTKSIYRMYSGYRESDAAEQAFPPNRPVPNCFSGLFVRCRRMLGGYLCSPRLQTVVDYSTTPHPSTHCPPDLLFKRFTCSCARRGGVWIPYNSGYTQTLSLAELRGDSQGKVISRSATCSAQDNLTIWITGLYVKAELSRLYEEASGLLVL